MISIIITAYKEPETIGKAIQYILDEKIKEKHEILITAPDDETLNAAKTFAKENKAKIKIIKDEGKGKPNALNLVFSKAKGDILVLTDGDVYCKNCSSLIKYFKDPKVGAVSGRPVSLNSKNYMIGYWSHLLFYYAHLMRKKRDQQNKFIFCTGYIFAMRKGLVNKIPTYALDDAFISECIWAKGYKIKYDEQALAFVKNPTTFHDWVKQKKRNLYSEFQLKQYRAKIKEETNFDGELTMRSFKGEMANGLCFLLKYQKNIKEVFWTGMLFLARLYAWISAYKELSINKKPMQEIWLRVETTK